MARKNLEWGWLDKVGLWLVPFFLAWVGVVVGKLDGTMTSWGGGAVGLLCGAAIINGVTYGVRAMERVYRRPS